MIAFSSKLFAYLIEQAAYFSSVCIQCVSCSHYIFSHFTGWAAWTILTITRKYLTGFSCSFERFGFVCFITSAVCVLIKFCSVLLNFFGCANLSGCHAGGIARVANGSRRGERERSERYHLQCFVKWAAYFCFYIHCLPSCVHLPNSLYKISLIGIRTFSTSCLLWVSM